ncbi:hypothetical protein HMPREF9120_01228 [Neisseria sp. oral taxon 020 str. F0370]|nr:hypothetical protein HMPREF9120_01228 [Neisseria sp. oral taxon 020 str. F0370]
MCRPAFRAFCFSVIVKQNRKDTRQQTADNTSSTGQVFLAFPMP